MLIRTREPELLKENLITGFSVSLMIHVALIILLMVTVHPVQGEVTLHEVELVEIGGGSAGGTGGANTTISQEMQPPPVNIQPVPSNPEEVLPPVPQPNNNSSTSANLGQQHPSPAPVGESGANEGMGNRKGTGTGQGNVPENGAARALEVTPAVYPQEAVQKGKQGTSIIRVLVGPDGQPMKTEVVTSSGIPELDQAAQDACMRSHFAPAHRNGKSAEDWVEIPFRFWITYGKGSSDTQPQPSSSPSPSSSKGPILIYP